MRSMNRERPLNVGTLWIVPIVYLGLVASMLVALPPRAGGWSLIAIGVVTGAGLGWHRGKLIRIERNAETGQLMQRASPLAMLLLVALIVLKLGARMIFGESAAAQAGSHAMLMTDVFKCVWVLLVTKPKSLLEILKRTNVIVMPSCRAILLSSPSCR